MSQSIPFLVGLTGGIAAGKSAVADMLAELGVAVVDADQVSREVMAAGAPAVDAIVAAFGEEVIDADGLLDRRALGRLVFSDEARRRQLEAITHPAIARASSARFLRAAEAGHMMVVYEAALLVETGRHEQMDRLVVVVADDALRLGRLMARDAIGVAAARQRMASQLPQAEKARLADFVVDNSGGLEETRARVAQVHRELCVAAGSKRRG